MMRNGKRFLALLVVLALAFSLIPAAVFAEGETHVFVSQPQSTVQLDPEELTYTVTWSTNFMPTQVDVMRRAKESFHDDAYVGSPYALNGELSFAFPANASVDQPYYIKAYYLDEATGETMYIVSNDFTLDRSSLVFSLQPEPNPVMDEYDLTWTVHWTTNFIPTKIQIVKDEGHYEPYNTTIVELTDNLQISGSRVFNYNTVKNNPLYLRAYYANGLYVTSDFFTLTEPEMAFTEQPPMVVPLGADLQHYTVSWATNFIPDRIKLVIDGNETTVACDEELRAHMSWPLSVSTQTEHTYQIRAYKGLDCVDSTEFTLNNSLNYTTQPAESISIRADSLDYLVSWRTNFVPVKFEVVYRDPYGSGDEVVAEVTDNLQMDMVHVLPGNSPDMHSYYIRAYFTEQNYLQSGFFRLNHDSLKFENQPDNVVIDPAVLAGSTQWTMNFLPLKIEVLKKVDSSGQLFDTIYPASSNDFNYPFFANMSHNTVYFLRAYFANTERAYIQSAEFSVDISQLVFTKQPILIDHHDGLNTLSLSWETSFVPQKVVIRCNDEEFSYLGMDSIVAELTEDLAGAGSYTFTWDAGTEHEFYVQAHYAPTFEITSENAVPAGFTMQPETGFVTRNIPYQVRWNTNFTPVRKELYCTHLIDGAYEDVYIDAIGEGENLTITYETAEPYFGELYHLRVWYGAGEDDYVRSVSFSIRPGLELYGLPGFSIGALYSSHVFTEEEEWHEEGSESWSEYTAFGNNATGSDDFAYRIHCPDDPNVRIDLLLLDASGSSYTVAQYYGGENQPENLIPIVNNGNDYTISTTIPALREFFHSFDEGGDYAIQNPDIFSVELYIENSHFNTATLTLRDIHAPVKNEDEWGHIDFDSFTLTTPLMPAFPDEAPAVTSANCEYYVVISTYDWRYQEAFPSYSDEDMDWRMYYYADEHEVNGEYVPFPVEERFPYYFGNGYNDYRIGQVNSAPRGPANYVYGIAANKLICSGTSLEAASACLADFINDQNEAYINSLPGLSPYSWLGYYPDGEEPEDWGDVDLQYEYNGSVDIDLIVTFADGVTYHASTSLISGMGDGGGFHVVGDTYTLPKATIHSASAVFEGQIRLKYYYTIPDSLLGQAGAAIVFYKDGTEVSRALLSAGVPVTGGEHAGQIAYYYNVVPSEIRIPVVTKILDGNGNPVIVRSESGTDYTDGFEYSVQTYAEHTQQNSSDEAMRNLAKALEDYGTAAALYFKSGDTSGLTVGSAVTAVSAEDLMQLYALSTAGTKPAGFTGCSISVMFESDNSLRIYFKFDGSKSPDQYTYLVDGNTAVLSERSDGALYLTVRNIPAAQLGDMHTFTISDGTDTYTVTASVLSYALTSIQNGSEARQNLGKALYLYYLAAYDCFGN